MPQRIYNRFDLWIKQDNTATFAWSPSFIDSKNLDWLKDWQGITLWPKVNKWILTNWAVTGINMRSLLTEDTSESLVWTEDWEIYRLDSADNTPEFTIAWKVIIKTVLWDNFYYIFVKTTIDTANMDIYRVNQANASLWDFSSLSSRYVNQSFVTFWTFPILIAWDTMFIWVSSSIKTIKYESDPATLIYGWVIGSFWFVDDFVKWLTLQWSTIAVYTRSGKVFFWDWGATLESARGYAWARVCSVINLNGRDYITFEDWQMKVWSYTQFQKIFKPNISFRLEDNTQVQTKFDFSVLDYNKSSNSEIGLDDIYFSCNDSVKWIYKYGSIIPWTQPGIHKIITENHLWDTIDEIYTMYFHERDSRKLYFSYSSGATYWVDYIDLDDLESCSSWYWVTEVFTWGTSFLKNLNVVRVTFQNTDADKTANLYYRINNWSWELLRTINSTTEGIYYRENISNDLTGWAFKEFIDIQFKVELASTTNDNKPPMMCELFIDYSITKS